MFKAAAYLKWRYKKKNKLVNNRESNIMSLNISNIPTCRRVNQDAFDIQEKNIGASKKDTKSPPSRNKIKNLSSFENNQYKSSPPSKSTGFFRAVVSKFINYLTGTFGKKMGCTNLNYWLSGIFSENNGWETKSTFTNGGTIQIGCRSQQRDDVTYVVSSPSHDLPENNSVQALLSGGRSAAQTLSEIKKIYSKEKVKALIPIAQSNTLGCFGTRGHFVLLEVDMNAGNILSAKIHDSKGILIDMFYNGSKHLTKQLLAEKSLNLEKTFSVTTNNRSEQSLFNGNDCGRYTAYYAATIIEEGNLIKASTTNAKAFFSKYF